MRKKFVSYSLMAISVIVVISCYWYPVWWLLLISLAILLCGLYDMFQTKHTIWRNFPVIGRGRLLMEILRPPFYQYFVESDVGGAPYSRMFRSVIYRRAKKELDTSPFGTKVDVYRIGYEWMNHSLAAINVKELDQNLRVKVGGPDCSRPYNASIFNISAMSFGALSKNAILAMNAGAKLGCFAHNTGEGGISSYHLENSGDLVWQIGTGYFGCRDKEGNFSEELFREKAVLPSVKMVEIKLSQGAKPGHGGILPAKKNSPGIAAIRNVEPYTTVESPPAHRAFSKPLEMMDFIEKLRKLSNGKPIGFKLCVGRKVEFIALCKAMVKTGIKPDFITVDGGEGGTGAAPLEYANSVGMPLREALAFVVDCLMGFDLKKDIRIIASGKIISGFHLVKNLALGADMCNAARAMMMALGCIQALECNKNTCPTGVATQNPALVVGLVVSDKKKRVSNYHQETVSSVTNLMSAAGLRTVETLNRSFIQRRVSSIQCLTYEEIYPYIPTGSLLQNNYPPGFDKLMTEAGVDSFAPV